jgi:radical SAM protein with 4Fe4S-binding SPASM domain
MCYFSTGKRDIRRRITMSPELFRKIARQVFPKAYRLQLSCGAEPLMTENFPEYLRVMKKYRIPMTGFFTNGLLLCPEIVGAILDAGLTRLEVSVDGGSKETYEKIRRGGNFETVIRNLELLREMKARQRSRTPSLHLRFTLMRSNLNDLPEFVRLAKNIGASDAGVSHVRPLEGLDLSGELLEGCREETKAVLERARDLARELGFPLTLPADAGGQGVAGPSPVKPRCQIPEQGMYVSPDGDAVPCLFFPMKKWKAGNFQRQNFREIWNGEVYRSLRRRFEVSDYPEECRACPA